MLRYAVWLKLTEASEVLFLMMEAANTSQTFVNFARLLGTTCKKTATFLSYLIKICKKLLASYCW
jgi:hypothetical protein